MTNLAEPSPGATAPETPSARPPLGAPDGPLALALWNLALALVYFAAAKLGLSMSFLAQQVSPVWPPTGLALAAVLLVGPRLWPGIAVGALLATAGEPLATAAGVALGNTIEAVFGGALLRRVATSRSAVEGLREVVALVALAAGLAPAIAATLGTVSLCLGGVVPWSQLPALWSVWWLGDAMGALVVAPLVLAWIGRPARQRAEERWSTPRRLELVALLAGLVAVAALVFGRRLPVPPGPAPEYAVFPFVIWAALRFRQRGVTLVAALLSVLAIIGTLRGGGPFAGDHGRYALVLLQTYLAVVTITGLFLAAAIRERDRAERERNDAARLAEQGLRAEAAFRRAIESSVHAGIAAVDLEGRQSYVNPAFARMVGWSAEELVGSQAPFPYWPAETASTIRAAFAATLHGVPPAGGFELRFQRRDGSRFDALVHTSPLIDGEGRHIGWLAAVSDISARKAIEAALRKSEERYRSLVTATAQVVWVTTADGEVVEDLPTWRELTGQSFEEMLGRGWMERVHPDDRERAGEVWAHSLATRTAHRQEFRLRTADGSYRHVVGRAVPVLEPDGRLREWIGTCSDVSERVRLERELRQRVSELAESDRRKDEFLAMLAHELRNPLAAMASAVDGLRVLGTGEARAEAMLAILDRQTRHLSRLVGDLLDASRITLGEIPLHRERVSLGEVVARAVETARPAASERGHELRLVRGDEELLVDADPVRLEQITSNLLANAIKYTERGGNIAVEVARDGASCVALRVNDDGIGIGPELLPRVFDLFTQGDRSLDRSQGGLGIGLTLVRRLVELHGGSVEARSDGPGRGSELTVRLPLAGGV